NEAAAGSRGQGKGSRRSQDRSGSDCSVALGRLRPMEAGSRASLALSVEIWYAVCSRRGDETSG
ncbi:MAG TPA: hypothetical protein VEK15_32800, partial [Vicinamibacteria bacterium]|nr:hypothetical protein [Vicinamibacteria bacterium]